MNWYVIKVRSRWELKVYQALLARGMEVYCPSYTEVRQWSDRRKKVRRPYFNGYVFVRLQEKDRNRVFRTQGVLQYLFWQGKVALVQESEMKIMKAYLDGGAMQDVKMERLSMGDKVRFGSGAFKGCSAYVEEIGKYEVRLVLPVLGYRITTRAADLVL